MAKRITIPLEELIPGASARRWCTPELIPGIIETDIFVSTYKHLTRWLAVWENSDGEYWGTYYEGDQYGTDFASEPTITIFPVRQVQITTYKEVP